MAEFSLLRGFVDKRSYLDIDDINGPGLRTYKKISAFSSVDFALFKIQGFGLSESPSDRKKFVIELPNTIEDLGQAAYQYLDPILTSIHSEDCQEVKKELAIQFPAVVSIITQSTVLNKLTSKSYLEVIRLLALSTDLEVSRAMIESIPLIIPYLHQGKVNNEVIGIAISLVLEKSREDITVMALGLVSKIAKDIGSNLTEKYFYREIFEISQDYTVNIGKAVVELIAEAFKLPFADSLRSKLIGVFIKFMESDNWSIRKHCISFLPRVYKNSDQSMQDLLLPLFIKSLKDKKKFVKEQSINTCCCIIVYSKIPIPNEIIKNFLKVSDSGHYHAAYYFPGVLLTLGTNHWPELKKLLLKLSDSDIRTKTCIVKSFHEIGKILGAEVTGKELIDLYEKFLEDEEIKFTAYENLPNFLREIFPEARDKYKGIVKGMGREKEWRSRNLMAKNICEYIGVYDYNCIYSEIWPLALELCEDLHCTVRLNAAKEVAKLAMYLLSKNSDWRRHIEMCIKKYALGSVNNRIVFLKIVKHFAGTELAADFTEEILNLSKDKVKNVRIMCAEAVNFSSKLDHVWSNAKEILLNDEDKDVLFEFGRAMKFNNNVLFVTPPIMRRVHNIEVGGIVKFSHANPPKFAKIEDFEDISHLVS